MNGDEASSGPLADVGLSDDDDGDGEQGASEVYYYSDIQLPDASTPAPSPNTTLRALLNVPRLGELNARKAESFYPIFIVLALILVVGVLSNALVCYIYRCRSRRATSNFLVISFAILDMAGCMLGISMVMTTLAMPYRFYVGPICKFVGFVETCSVCTLCLTLLCASYVYFCQLCVSGGVGGGLRWAHRYCSGALAVSVLVSIPALIAYNVHSVSTGYPMVPGMACGLDYKPWLLHLHHSLVLFCFGGALILMAIFYGIIGVTRFKQRQAQWRGDKPSPAPRQFPKKHRFVKEDTSSSSVTTGSYSGEIGRLHTARSQCHTNTPHHHHHHHHGHHHHHYHHYHHSHHQHTDPSRVPLKTGYDVGGLTTNSGTHDRSTGRGIVKSSSYGMMKTSSSQQASLLENSSSVTGLTSSGQATASPVVQLHVKNSRQAFIFFVISTVFVVCMAPYVVVTVLMASTDVFQRFSSNTTEVIVKLCLRSYLLNYLVKPFVYLKLNNNFREEVKQLFIKL